MIKELIRRGRSRMRKVAGDLGLAKEFKDVFELDGVPAYRQFYDKGIFLWKALYRGSYAPWHLVPAPTIDNPRAVRQMYRLNAAKAVSAELAGLVWGEQCGIRVSMKDGGEGDDPLNAFVASVLEENAFAGKLQQLIEQGLALGGAAIKVWYEAGEDGGTTSSVPPAAVHLPLKGKALERGSRHSCSLFVPLSWDNARVTEGVFISRLARGGMYYTRLEWHRWDGSAYIVENQLYRAEAQQGRSPGERQDILGVRVPLEDVYPGLDGRTEVRLGESLFTYWRTPMANNLDDDSPLGVSIYGNALETLHALDICYDSLVNEFRLGKKRIIVPARCVRTVADPSTGEMRRYFDPGDRVYEALATDDAGELRIQDNSVELRVEEHVAALNAFLSILCLQLGFSVGTFSFDSRGGLRTATEVVSENSKTFKTIRTVQNQLAPALEHLARNIIDVAILYGLSWQGQSVESLAAGGYEVQTVFDDGVTQDRQTSIAEGVKLVEAGLLSRYRFLTEAKYGQGLTPREAEEEIERLKAEKV